MATDFSQVSIIDCQFEENSSHLHFRVALVSALKNSQMTIKNTQFINNNATNVLCNENSEMRLFNTSFMYFSFSLLNLITNNEN